MSQNQQLFLLANIVSVNTTANTLTFTSNSNIATSFNVGAYGNTTTGGFSANSSVIAVGNSSVNVVVNSSSVYVSGVALGAGGGTNAAAQYSWTNTQSFSAVVTHTANVSVNGAIIANGGAGTSGQVLTSSAGGNVYWSTAAGGFSNGASISVANLAITGSVTANGSVGTSGQALVSTGTGVQWGALSPGYNYSSQFNGSSQFLSITANSAFNLGTNSFTMEAWIYPTVLPTNNAISDILAQFDTGTGTTAFLFALYNNAGTMQLLFQPTSSATQTVIAGTYAFAINTWYHIAAVRNSNNIYLYVNGAQVGTTTAYSSSINTSSTALTVGARLNNGAWNLGFSGFISNLRFVNGTAVYTSAFTTPTSTLSVITNTVLLTCNSITPTSDSSTYNWPITNNGAVTTTATLSPFTSTTVSIPTQSLTAVRQQFTGDGSTTSFAVAGGYTANAISVFVNGVLLRNGTEVTVTNGSTVVFAIAPLSGALIDVIGTVPTTYSSITPVSYSTQFNGSSQYLTVPANAAFQMTGDFTYECWAYFSSFSTTPVFFDQWVNTTTGAGNFQAYCTTAGVLNFVYDGSSAITSSTLSTNIWYHIAFTRTGSSIKVFVNGVQNGLATFAGTVGRSDITFWFGAQRSGGPIDYINGYFSNARVVKGVGVYTSNFTVPTSPLQAVQSASGAYIQAITGTQTSLLTCNGPTIIDGSTNAFTITNNGSAPVSTAIVPTFTNVTINNPVAFYPAGYLIVAGGGGGGGHAAGDKGGAGGGAGGLLTNYINLTTGISYTFTVGAGGAGATGGAAGTGSNGADSSILGSIFGINSALITATGGGGGASGAGGGPFTGAAGGSGGGGVSSGVAYGTPGTGISGQGNAGGTNTGFNNSGGGGGAGAVGGGATASTGGTGGVGLASTITGSSVYYAGGGGGVAYSGTNGAGGLGGGGAATTTTGTAGTTNLGGGGGGGGGGAAGSSYNGGAGGSGVVILSVPTAYYSGTTTGSPTVTTNGIYTVLKFTASGTYTA